MGKRNLGLRSGQALVEVMVGMVIAAILMLAMASFMSAQSRSMKGLRAISAKDDLVTNLKRYAVNFGGAMTSSANLGASAGYDVTGNALLKQCSTADGVNCDAASSASIGFVLVSPSGTVMAGDSPANGALFMADGSYCGSRSVVSATLKNECPIMAYTSFVSHCATSPCDIVNSFDVSIMVMQNPDLASTENVTVGRIKKTLSVVSVAGSLPINPTSTGLANRIAKWVTNTDLGNSPVLYEDPVSGNIGVRTTTPNATLHLSNATASSGFQMDAFGAGSPYITHRQARGTAAAPAATQSGDWLSSFYANGYGSNTWVGGTGINIFATENYTNSAGGSKMAFYTTPNGSATSAVRMTLDQNGNVGVGTITPAQPLHLSKNSAGDATRFRLTETAVNRSWDIGVFGANATPGIFGIADMTASQWRMVIDTAGKVGIGRTDPQYTLDVTGNIRMNQSGVNGVIYGAQPGNFGGREMVLSLDPPGGVNDEIWIGPNAGVMTGHIQLIAAEIGVNGCMTFNDGTQKGVCPSDERMKENVHPFLPGLKEVIQMRPVHYQYNGFGEHQRDGVDHVGVIAQELEKTAPELVGERKVKLHPDDKDETVVKTVSYGSFTYMLINAIRELYQRLTEIFAVSEKHTDEIIRLKSELEEQRRENTLIRAYLCSREPDASICR